MNRALLSFCAVACVLAVAFFRFERSRFSSKEVPLIALLAAMAALGRIPCAGLPGIQPTTFVVIISGFVFGPSIGFLVGAVAAAASNIFLGQGPWTVWQMFAWGLCGCSAGVLGHIRPGLGRTALASFAFAWGYLFGWVTNFWYWYAFIQPLTLASWLSVNSMSFPFDTLHAAGNAAFTLFLGHGFRTALAYFKKRLELTSISC